MPDKVKPPDPHSNAPDSLASARRVRASANQRSPKSSDEEDRQRSKHPTNIDSLLRDIAEARRSGGRDQFGSTSPPPRDERSEFATLFASFAQKLFSTTVDVTRGGDAHRRHQRRSHRPAVAGDDRSHEDSVPVASDAAATDAVTTDARPTRATVTAATMGPAVAAVTAVTAALATTGAAAIAATAAVDHDRVPATPRERRQDRARGQELHALVIELRMIQESSLVEHLVSPSRMGPGSRVEIDAETRSSPPRSPFQRPRFVGISTKVKGHLQSAASRKSPSTRKPGDVS